MAKEILVRIEGLSDYLQHKRLVEDEDKTRQKSGEVDYSEEWKKSVYRDEENGCYIPSKQLRAMLVKAATNFRIKGRMGKTYKDLMNATVEVIPDRISLEKKEPDYVHQEFVRVQRNQVLRNRPAFKKGWKAGFTLLVMDDQMGTVQLREILEFGGKFVGIGDWRPRFGRFGITEFNENGVKRKAKKKE